jgi:hypothetical protein
MEIITVIAVIIASLVVIMSKLAKDEYEKYQGYVLMAFAYVEKTVPDDFGVNETDPAWAKMMHKIDLFSKKFPELVKQFTGVEANKTMINWAIRMASHLATNGK